MELNELTAISPIDGRYRKQVEELSKYFSEEAFIRYRVEVELKWLVYLLKSDFINENLSQEELDKIESINIDAIRVKEIEQTTNHDVKAIEYYIREELEKMNLKTICYLVHFGLTSEDINNIAYGLMIKDAMVNIMIPKMEELMESVKLKSIEYKDIPMLSHTHGQPATPTTVGKELAVFIYRWQNSLEDIKYELSKIKGKFSSAVGNFNAFKVAYPNVDWFNFNKQFVNSLGLEFNNLSTQIENHDTICMLFSAIKNFNNITQDFNSDMWLYISMNYFSQKAINTEVGSSVMPHKINPINHENSMANIRIANSLFDSFTNNLQISRMQRDLSDSSMLRNIGVSFSHTLVSLNQTIKGFNKMEVNRDKLNEDLDNNPEVLAEAIQTVLRKNKYDNGYELLKEFTRGKRVTIDDLKEFINGLDINEEDKQNLLNLIPNSYLGIASNLCEKI